MAQDKAMTSLCPAILQLEDWERITQRPGRGGSPLSSPSLAEGNSPDPSATAWLGPRGGGNCSLGRSRGHIRTLRGQF